MPIRTQQQTVSDGVGDAVEETRMIIAALLGFCSLITLLVAFVLATTENYVDSGVFVVIGLMLLYSAYEVAYSNVVSVEN